MIQRPICYQELLNAWEVSDAEKILAVILLTGDEIFFKDYNPAWLDQLFAQKKELLASFSSDEQAIIDRFYGISFNQATELNLS